MKKLYKVYVDSDVVISSLISSKGAANLLMNNKQIIRFISNFSQNEVIAVCARLKIEKEKLDEVIKNNFKIVKLKKILKDIKEEFKDYVLDINDAHIAAGAKISKADFLVTYNLKHYKTDKIKTDLGIIILTPALLLQHLRSH